MSKLEVNNEIVLMRHCVRQARLHIVRRLIKQVKMLRLKKGNEKQIEKYKRKADKLAEELIASKKIQLDQVSKFSITNEQKLEEILSDPKSSPEKCLMARLANYKVIIDKVVKFKEKFPNYEEHLGPGKRKLMKLRRKANKQAKKESKEIQPDSDEKEMVDRDLNVVTNEENDSIKSGSDNQDNLSETNEDNKVQENLQKITQPVCQEKTLSSDKEIKKTITQDEKRPKVEYSKEKLKKLNKLPPKILLPTSKEATVKSFTKFLEEDNEKNSPNTEITKDSEIVLEKEVDSFFVTENGEGEYLSVVVPKSNIEEEENVLDNRHGGWRQRKNNSENTRESNFGRNGRYFDKLGNIDKNNFDKSKRFKEENHRNINTRKDNGLRKRGGVVTEDKLNHEMHPSWVAKKKQQEIINQGFQGKKIVFDDV